MSGHALGGPEVRRGGRTRGRSTGSSDSRSPAGAVCSRSSGARNPEQKLARRIRSPSRPPTKIRSTGGPASDLFEWRGKHYRKGSGCSEVNSNHSIEEIEDYVKQVREVAQSGAVECEVPFESIEDYVVTLRQSASTAASAFRWPTQSLSFQKGFSVALQHVPPGCFVVLRNSSPMPHFLRKSEHEVHNDVLEMYHGTTPQSFLRIAEDGFLPSFGAGASALQAHFGVAVPGVYLAKSWTVATWYPAEATSQRVAENKHGVPGGALLSVDGAHPMRLILRCVVRSSDHIWKRGSNQSLFKPQSVYISHACFWATAARLCSVRYLGVGVQRVSGVDEDTLPEGDPRFRLVCRAGVESAADSREERQEYGTSLLVQQPGDVPMGFTSEVYYQQKQLLSSWLEGRRPVMRMATLPAEDLGMFMGPGIFKEVLRQSWCAMEVDVRRGLKWRMQRFCSSRGTDTLGRATSDGLPLARRCSCEETQAVNAYLLVPLSTERCLGQAASVELSKKEAKKRSQREERSEVKKVADFAQQVIKDYGRYLRIATTSFIKMPGDYLNSFQGICDPPAIGTYVSPSEKYILPGGDTPAAQSLGGQRAQRLVLKARENERTDLEDFIRLIDKQGQRYSAGNVAWDKLAREKLKRLASSSGPLTFQSGDEDQKNKEMEDEGDDVQEKPLDLATRPIIFSQEVWSKIDSMQDQPSDCLHEALLNEFSAIQSDIGNAVPQRLIDQRVEEAGCFLKIPRIFDDRDL